MTQDNASSSNALLCFLAGAAAGALLVALTTPKKGADLREDLADLGRRAGRRAGDVAGKVKGAYSAVRDQALRGKSGAGNRARDAWEDIKRDAWEDVKRDASRTASDITQDASRAGADLKEGMQDVARDLGS